MKYLKLAYPILGVMILLFLKTKDTEALAQYDNWSFPYQISGLYERVNYPNLLVDEYGYAHVFWVGSQQTDSREIIGYSKFDGENWTYPVDIYSSDHRIPITAFSSSIDEDGIIHLIWTEGGNVGPIHYTSAQSLYGSSAMNWRRQQIIDFPAYRANMIVDSRGIYHLVYGVLEGEEGIYYTQSEDEGVNWSNPIELDTEIPVNYVPKHLRFTINNDELHVLWTLRDINDPSGADKSILYVNSYDGGLSWSFPILIDDEDDEIGEVRAAAPCMIANNNSVLIVWAGDSTTHREYRFSIDSGRNWSHTYRIFGDLHGQAGDGMTIDSVGRIHYIAQIRYPQGLYHAQWRNGDWTIPMMFYQIFSSVDVQIPGRVHAHSVQAAVLSGNQLIIIFTDPPADLKRRLFAMHMTIEDVPSIDLKPTPIANIKTITPIESILTTSEPSKEDIHLATPWINDVDPKLSKSNASVNTYLPGLISSLIFLVGIVFVVILKKR